MALSHRKNERARWYIATAIRVTDSYQPIVARSTVAVTNQSHMQLDHYSNVTQISRSNPLIVSIFAEAACHVPRSLRAGRPAFVMHQHKRPMQQEQETPVIVIVTVTFGFFTATQSLQHLDG